MYNNTGEKILYITLHILCKYDNLNNNNNVNEKIIKANVKLNFIFLKKSYVRCKKGINNYCILSIKL